MKNCLEEKKDNIFRSINKLGIKEVFSQHKALFKLEINARIP